MSGPFGNRGSNESREQTIANGPFLSICLYGPNSRFFTASRKIQSLASVMRLSEVVCLAATRLYTLAVEHKFTKGRKSLNVVAVCLYVACRQKETRNYMLIDFSDLLQVRAPSYHLRPFVLICAQVNVFELGHTYLQLVQTLNLRLPLVDPSHYISRFAALLEFGEETQKVSTDAVRLIQRFDRDWMTKGRRPAGICGAALLLAARMNNFRRSVEEVVQVVKIADSTVRKRLDEFKGTKSGDLTVADFRSVWLEEEMDPPAFVKGKDKEDSSQEDSSQEDPSPLFLPEDLPRDENIDPSLLSPSISPQLDFQSEASPAPLPAPPNDEINESENRVLAEEVSNYLHNPQGAMLQSALDEAEQRRLAQITVGDDLLGLDEEELDQFIMTEEEVKIKERVWVELNKDYLEAIAGGLF